MVKRLFKSLPSKGDSCFVLFGLVVVAGALAVIYWLQPQPKERLFGVVCNIDSCYTVAVEEVEPYLALRESATDLIGDGLPETVAFEDNSLAVFKDGIRVWKSDSDWHVVDYALGDPNDDGRNEILVALWKPDDQGTLHSQPFIVGFRGGRYKTIWGGSAVTYGIHELLLTDLDGDGRQELIVLESADSADGLEATLRTLSVWDWHGWGFSLRWRSEAGHYSNLGLAPSEGRNDHQILFRQLK
jgi:hypothetical protein